MNNDFLYRFRLKGTNLYYGGHTGRFQGEMSHFNTTGKFYQEKYLKQAICQKDLEISDAQIRRYNILYAKKSWHSERQSVISRDHLELVKYRLEEINECS